MPITRQPTAEALGENKIARAIKTLRNLAQFTDGLDTNQERQQTQAESALREANGLATLKVYLTLANADLMAKQRPLRMDLNFHHRVE